MRYLAILKPIDGKPVEEIKALMVPELRTMWDAYKAGRLREFYFSATPPVVTLVYEVADADSARRELNELPLVAKGLLDYHLIEQGPFPQFEVLFSH
jgi:hypothetical protein